MNELYSKSIKTEVRFTKPEMSLYTEQANVSNHFL